MALSQSTLLSSVTSFSRASTALDYDSTGTLSSVAQNILCNGYDPTTISPAGMYLGGGITNLVTNPNGEYATAPTYPTTTPPDKWRPFTAAVNGVGITVVGRTTEGGLSGVLLRYSGTATATTVLSVEPIRPTVSSLGSIYSMLIRAKLNAGNTNGISFTLAQRELGGAVQPVLSTTPVTPTNISINSPSSTFRVTSTTTQADTTTLSCYLQSTFTANQAVDCTIFVAGWTVAKTSVIGLPILPIAGSQISQVRAADNLSIPNSVYSSRILSNRATFRADVHVSQISGPISRTIAQFSDNTDSNRLTLEMIPNSYGIQSSFYVAGALISQVVSTQVLQPNTRVGMGIRFDSTTGQIGISVNGENVLGATGLTIPNFTTMQLGNNVSLTAPLEGRLPRMTLLPAFLQPDSIFRGVCTTGAQLTS